MKLKEFGPPGGRASPAPPLDPPLDLSTNAHKFKDAQFRVFEHDKFYVSEMKTSADMKKGVYETYKTGHV